MKLAFVTGNRADWNALGMVAKACAERGHEVVVKLTGDKHAWADVIMDDGFRPDAGMADGVQYDAVVVLGDRHEILRASLDVKLLGHPLIHLSGGDRTRGSLDDRFRDAISALADVHFPTNQDAARRLARLGCDHVFCYGSPAVDRIKDTPIVGRDQFFATVNVKPREINVLVAVHAATLERDPLAACRETLKACQSLGSDASFLLVGTNDDPGAPEVQRMLGDFARECDRATLVGNLPPSLYFSALTYMDLMVGNSSSAYYEAPSFGIPVVDVGARQRGRYATISICNVQSKAEHICSAMLLWVDRGRSGDALNPYGDGSAAGLIADQIGFLRDRGVL